MTLTTERTEITENDTEDLNILSGKIVDCSIQVHRKLGPGLLESAYQHGLAYMLSKHNVPFEKEKMISIMIDDLPIDAGYRADFIIQNKIIVEIKSVEKLLKNGIKRMRL